MNATMKELGIDRLSLTQQIELALEIWANLGEARPPGRLTNEQLAELVRRDDELDAQPELGQTWQQIRASVEKAP